MLCTFALGVLSACSIGSSASETAAVKTTGINKDITVNGKLAGPKGINSNSLFAGKVKNNDERFERLESAVQSLHDSLNTYLPAIEKLAAIEGDIQELVEQLQTLVNEPEVSAEPLAHITTSNVPSTPSVPVISPPAPTKAAEAPAASKEPAASPAPANTASSGTQNIRVSQSADKTRVVLDSPNKIDFKLDYDAQENVILLTANNADFAAALNDAAKKSKHIRSITSSKDGNSTVIVLELQGVTSVSPGKNLPPGGGNNNHRYYFDIL